jgi:hypothetical protein
MLRNKTSDCETEILKIMNSIYHAGNYSAIDNFSSDLTMMTLKSLQNGKHPVINYRNFITDILPIPNMTIFDHNTGNYTGVRFNANCSMALDLFSINRNFGSRSFISVEELKRMKLDGNIKHEDQISIVVGNHWTKNKSHHNSVYDGFTSIRIVNMECLLKSFNNSIRGLTENDFTMYFPDYGKQILYQKNYSNNLVKSMQAHINSTSNYDLAKSKIAIDTKNSYLPKLSAEMAHYQFCRLTRSEFIPKFSREDHLNDIITLHSKNHELLTNAIKQSCSLVDISINRLLGSRKAQDIHKTLEQKPNIKAHNRKRPM